MLVDADPSGSALEWADLAAMDPRLAPPQAAFPFRIVALPSRDLHRRLPEIAQADDVVIIDTPQLEDHAAIALSALRYADEIVIPCAPSPIEINRTTPVREEITEVAAARDRPARSAVLLNRCVARAHSTADAREALAGLGYDVLGTAVPRLEVYAQSFGRPVPATGRQVWRRVARDLIERCTLPCSVRSGPPGHHPVQAGQDPPGPSPGLYRQLTRWADPATIALNMPRRPGGRRAGHDQGESRAPGRGPRERLRRGRGAVAGKPPHPQPGPQRHRSARPQGGVPHRRATSGCPAGSRPEISGGRNPAVTRVRAQEDPHRRGSCRASVPSHDCGDALRRLASDRASTGHMWITIWRRHGLSPLRILSHPIEFTAFGLVTGVWPPGSPGMSLASRRHPPYFAQFIHKPCAQPPTLMTSPELA